MAKLTPEMKDLMDKALAFLATADEQGNPQVGPKGTMRAFDDEHLIYNEETGRQAWHNIQKTCKAAVAFHPTPGLKGFRVEGRAHTYTDGPYMEAAKKFVEGTKLPQPLAAVIIDVDRIVSLDAGPNAGKEIANDPVKD
ncbi:pyridoxamine 5'-phosphate oxidase family protein [Schleiferilactobacillus perolens]|jgi:predicted pyridoxine 5'-phosphate oxidase superfamily flavin-nucleotide-binding protein|uniref:pyridoxamine 5'-phosphate oxidase family protein n=1 Tax=Schleiferilactobacillus perolens TaxID=100468 RepID=UPI00235586DF|nr:pyridoxamine 5'-phosphate oxidase family protein [Schleiferilactobacillus perolens]MCI2170567.1 pyridoxamine 5'-phosphate oxidase family protein [Schleiferilactobacillus perolens]